MVEDGEDSLGTERLAGLVAGDGDRESRRDGDVARATTTITMIIAREGYLRLDVDVERGNVGLQPDVCVSERAREVYEALGSGGHTGQILRRSVVECVLYGMAGGGGGGRCQSPSLVAIVTKIQRFCDLQVWRLRWGCAH